MYMYFDFPGTVFVVDPLTLLRSYIFITHSSEPTPTYLAVLSPRELLTPKSVHRIPPRIIHRAQHRLARHAPLEIPFVSHFSCRYMAVPHSTSVILSHTGTYDTIHVREQLFLICVVICSLIRINKSTTMIRVAIDVDTDSDSRADGNYGSTLCS